MYTIIISIILGIIGYTLGTFTGATIFSIIFGLCGFFLLPFYMLEKIYYKLFKDK